MGRGNVMKVCYTLETSQGRVAWASVFPLRAIRNKREGSQS